MIGLETTIENLKVYKQNGEFNEAAAYLFSKLPHIHKNCSIGKTIANDITNLSSKKLPIIEKWHLGELIDKCVSIFMPCTRSTIRTELNYDSPVYCDKKMIMSVFINLIHNATKYAHGEEIWVITKKSSESVLCVVGNKGSYIPEKKFREIFTLFHTDGNGKGIGLASSQTYIELHNGKIWVKSSPENITEFYFTLPICKE